jgi:hypothetical protein
VTRPTPCAVIGWLAVSPSRRSRGRRAIKVEPRPYWLSTEISPPISVQSWRTIDRPSPVPPNLRAVPASAW